MDRELLLLGLLRHGDLHGYRLHEFVERDLATCTDLKKPTAYFLLEKMAKSGWIEERSERAGNRPRRKVYVLTPSGEEAFHRLLRENVGRRAAVRFADDIGLAFLDTLPPAEAHDLLDQRRAQIVADLAETRRTPAHAGSLQLVVDHAVHHLESELAWLDSVLGRLAGSAGPKEGAA